MLQDINQFLLLSLLCEQIPPRANHRITEWPREVTATVYPYALRCSDSCLLPITEYQAPLSHVSHQTFPSKKKNPTNHTHAVPINISPHAHARNEESRPPSHIPSTTLPHHHTSPIQPTSLQTHPKPTHDTTLPHY